jgi:hypothetical protein
MVKPVRCLQNEMRMLTKVFVNGLFFKQKLPSWIKVLGNCIKTETGQEQKQKRVGFSIPEGCIYSFY